MQACAYIHTICIHNSCIFMYAFIHIYIHIHIYIYMECSPELALEGPWVTGVGDSSEEMNGFTSSTRVGCSYNNQMCYV